MTPLYVRVSMDLLDILVVFGAGGLVGIVGLLAWQTKR